MTAMIGKETNRDHFLLNRVMRHAAQRHASRIPPGLGKKAEDATESRLSGARYVGADL